MERNKAWAIISGINSNTIKDNSSRISYMGMENTIQNSFFIKAISRTDKKMVMEN